MERVVGGQVEMVNKLLAHLQKKSRSGKGIEFVNYTSGGY